MGDQIMPDDEENEYNLCKNEGMLKVTVQDEGPGMTAEEIDNAFKAFQKPSNLLSKRLNDKRNGIGLSICK